MLDVTQDTMTNESIYRKKNIWQSLIWVE